MLLAALGSALSLSGACKPSLDEDLSHVDGPRILAVQAEPPEAKPGEMVKLRALYTDGTAAAPTTDLGWSFCVVRPALAEPTALSAACLEGAAGALLPLGSAPEVHGVVPADACRLFGPDRPLGKPGEPAGRAADPDVTGGYYQPGIVRASGADDALFEVRVRCGLAGATQESVAAFERTYRSNTNPTVSDVAIVRGDREGAVADGAEIVALPGEVLTVRAGWPACTDDAACGGAERYPALDAAARVLVTRRESMRVSWLATRGKFASSRSGRAEDDQATSVDTTWVAPAERGVSAALWIVLRDARGGTGIRSLRVRTGP
ncbi:MAG: hypothetical protein JWP87_5027 [Labilithrix sp.]|nr:hypothetical protein [Labilithrix sp.]